MVNKTRGQLITEYALQSKDNLQIALAIIYSRNDIKRKVIADFLNALEEELKRSFPTPAWYIDNVLKQDIFAIYPAIYLGKEEWGNTPWIGFEAQQSQAKGFRIGIEKQPPSQSIGSLKVQMDEQYGQGRTDEWWEWYQDIGDGYGDWDNETMLLSLYQKEEAVQYFRSRLERIVEIAAPIIDAAVGHI